MLLDIFSFYLTYLDKDTFFAFVLIGLNAFFMVHVRTFVNNDVVFVLNDLIAILADRNVTYAFYFVLHVNCLELTGLI